MQLNSNQIIRMMELDEQYLLILQADEFVLNFDTMEAFETWCETGEVEDLEEVLKVFEDYELYEHCATIKKVIDAKHLE